MASSCLKVELETNKRSFYFNKVLKLCQNLSNENLVYLAEERDSIWMGLDTSDNESNDSDLSTDTVLITLISSVE